MLGKLQKWGNSQGVRLPKGLLRQVSLSVGDEVDISALNDEIIIKPIPKIRKRYRLEELLAKMPKKYEPKELDWGPETGKEVW